MKLNQLRDIVAIAEQGSLRAAARHLGTAQPALTRSLSELERELGAPLFERRSKGMIATRAESPSSGEQSGSSTMCVWRRMNSSSSAAMQPVRNPRPFHRGTFVAPTESLATVSTPISEGPPSHRGGFYPTLERGLQDGSVGLYIGPDPGLRLPPGLNGEVLLAGRRAVLCRSKHPLAHAVSLKELQDAEWITTSITPKAENEIGDLFRRHGLREPTLALQSQSALTLFTCLANSDLLAMAPAQWMDSPFANRILTNHETCRRSSRPRHNCHYKVGRAAGPCCRLSAGPHETCRHSCSCKREPKTAYEIRGSQIGFSSRQLSPREGYDRSRRRH